MISLRKYTVISLLTTGAVVYHAFATRRHFYPATLQLSTSKIAIATIGNFCFAMALCCYRLIIKIFLGTLRDIELEKINEKLSSAIMETCLALTIFRDEFNLFFLAMFAALAFVKVFHWLVQDRVDYMEVTPNVSRLQHLRIVSFMAFLLAVDSCFLQHTISNVLKSGGQSVHLLFAFEYVIQASSVVSMFIKYLLSRIDSLMNGRWENKGTYVFYLELITDMVHLFVYCIFFVIVFTNYGLPLHLIRDLYFTFRNFRNRIADFLRFRQVTARMDRFPDATEEDLQRCDGVCIICREEMSITGPNKKLHCGHVFHLHCLRSWLERQQNCPTCRAPVFRANNRPEAQQAGGAENAGNADNGAPAAAGGDGNAAGGGGGGGWPNLGRGDGAAGGAGAGALGADGLRRRAAAQRGGAGGGAATPPGAPTSAPPTATPGGYWGTTIPAGFAWQVPQWYPVTSMATFQNPMQYAGQQSADSMQALPPMMPLMPFLPTISAPFAPVIPAPPPTASPEQQQLHTQAAAAAMAAATAAMYTPLASLVMMPPAMLQMSPAVVPPSSSVFGGASSSTASTSGSSEGAASGSGAASAPSGSVPPAVSHPIGASMQATQQLLQQQVDYIQHLLENMSIPTTTSAAAPQAAATSPTTTTPSTSASTSTAAPSPAAAAAAAAAARQQAAGADVPSTSSDASTATGTTVASSSASTAAPQSGDANQQE